MNFSYSVCHWQWCVLQAVLFHNPLEGLRVDPRVVATIINPKIVRVFLFLYLKRLNPATYIVTHSLFFLFRAIVTDVYVCCSRLTTSSQKTINLSWTRLFLKKKRNKKNVWLLLITTAYSDCDFHWNIVFRSYTCFALDHLNNNRLQWSLQFQSSHLSVLVFIYFVYLYFDTILINIYYLNQLKLLNLFSHYYSISHAACWKTMISAWKR